MYNYRVKRDIGGISILKDRSKIGSCILHNLYAAIPTKAGMDLKTARTVDFYKQQRAF